MKTEFHEEFLLLFFHHKIKKNEFCEVFYVERDAKYSKFLYAGF